jgi:hypothetical protein
MQVSLILTGYMTEGCESRIDESPVDLFFRSVRVRLIDFHGWDQDTYGFNAKV